MEKGIDYPGISIAFFCHDGSGRYLLQKRGQNCRDEKGRWDFGSGGLDFGDTVEGTLQKEIEEEYRADVLSYEFLGYRDVFRESERGRTHWLVLYFKVLVDPRAVENGEPHKFDDMGWFSLDALPVPLHSQIPAVLELYKNRL